MSGLIIGIIVGALGGMCVARAFYSLNKCTTIKSNNSVIVQRSKTGTISINGQDFTGRNLTMNNGDVIIDGKKLDVDFRSESITINIEGNVENVETTAGDINCNTAMNIHSTSGDVTCHGDVDGNIQTVSGDVKCGKVSGNIKTISGDVK